MTAKIPPRAEELLAHLESEREIQRTDAIREAVDLYLTSYGYNPAA